MGRGVRSRRRLESPSSGENAQGSGGGSFQPSDTNGVCDVAATPEGVQGIESLVGGLGGEFPRAIFDIR